MEEGGQQHAPSHQSYHLDENESTEIIPIVNMDAGVQQQMTALTSSAESDMVTSNLISVPSELSDQTQWAIQIQLQHLDPETQFAIRQNLVADPNDPTNQSIITYDENGDAVVSKFDMAKIVDGGEISGNVFEMNRNVQNEQESLLLLQQRNEHPPSDQIVMPLDSITQTGNQHVQQTTHQLPLVNNQILVFCRVSATLSTEVMQIIPDYETVIWSEIQTEPDVQMEMTDKNQCTVYGSIDTIVKLNNKLQELLNGKMARTFHVKDKTQTTDVKVQCDMLVPHISSRGRQVHQPSRYTGFYKDPVSENENDSDDHIHKRKPKRRYLRPQKSTADVEPENSKVPEPISKPFKFACGQCSFKTARKSHMDKHLCFHENRNVQLLKCNQCTFVAIRRCHLNRHELQHHSTTVHSCDKCTFTTNQAFYLRRHKRLKHKTNKNFFTCPDCDFTTNQRVNYTRHLKLHVVTGEKQIFKCETCNYKTDVNARFQRHMTDVHGDARPYLCDDCGKSFKRTDALKAHKITHLQRKDRNLPHVCEICSKGFGSRAHLKEHEITHKKERPYLCHLCGASFKTQSVQKKHIATIHVHPGSFTCDVCNKRFNTRFTLSRHKRTHDNSSQVVTNVSIVSVNVADTIEQSDQTLVPDVIDENMGEPFDQSDALRQTYTPNETTTALFYLAENLTL